MDPGNLILLIATGLRAVVGNFFNILQYVAGAVAVLMVIVGGIIYATGNAKGGKQAVTWALVGLAIAVLSEVIVRFIDLEKLAELL